MATARSRRTIPGQVDHPHSAPTELALKGVLACQQVLQRGERFGGHDGRTPVRSDGSVDRGTYSHQTPGWSVVGGAAACGLAPLFP